MRKFNLYIDGVQYKLNGEDGIWFTNPEGLGMDLSPPTVNLRNGFFNKTDIDNIPQHTINGELVFKPRLIGTPAVWLSAADVYKGFAWSLNANASLEFGYTPDTSAAPTEYRTRVSLDYITKGDGNGRWIYCPVGFTVLSPWYTTETINLPLYTDEDNTNLYVADYTVVANAGAAFILTATGGGTPLAVSVGEKNTGNLYGMFNLEPAQQISNTGTFVFSNIPADSYATYTYTSGGNTYEFDLVNRAALNDVDMFGRMQPGKTNQILVLYTQGITKPTSISATIYNFYWSV